MLNSVSDLLRYDALIEDESHKVTELFFSPEDWRIAWLGLDIGGLLKSHQVICSTRILGAPDSARRNVAVEATRAEIEAAPRWTPEELRAAPEDAAMLVGPVGMAAGPLFLAGTETGAPPSDGEAKRVERRYDRATVWMGAHVEGEDERLGRVDDLLYDPDSKRVTHLVIDNGGVLPGRQLVTPVEVAGDFDDEARAVRVALTRERLDKAPQIETLDDIDRHWLDVLRTYYQLPV